MRPLDVPGGGRRARGGQRRAGPDAIRHRAWRRSSAIDRPTSTPLDAATGELLWKTRVDDFPFARVTGSPTFHNGRLYVGVASGEETAGAVADYECCKFRGSLVALDAATGTQVWKTYTIEEPKPTTKNKVGHAAVGAVGRADLVQPGDRHAAQRGLRHHRQQLQRPGHATTATRSWPST